MIEQELGEPHEHDAPRRGSAVTNVFGLVLSAAGLLGWAAWLAWRVATLQLSLIAVVVLALEIVAFSAALIVTAGLFAVWPSWLRDRRLPDADR